MYGYLYDIISYFTAKISLALPQQGKPRSEGYLGHGWEELGERNLAPTLWSPWTATWRKGLHYGSWAAGLAAETYPRRTSSAPRVHRRSCRRNFKALAAVRQRKGLFNRSLVAGLGPSSPRRTCSSAGPQNLSYALIGGEWGSGR